MDTEIREPVAGSEIRFKSAGAERIVAANLAIIGERYDGVLAYHDRSHTKDVMRDGTEIFDVAEEVYNDPELNLKERYPGFIEPGDGEVVQIGCGGHDCNLEKRGTYEEEATYNGISGVILKLKRFDRRPGECEEDSAREQEELMDQEVDEEGHPAYTKRQKSAMTKGVVATTPTFDKDLQTVVQQALRDSPIETMIEVAIPLGDLARSGTDPQRFIEEGNRVAREDYLGIRLLDEDTDFIMIRDIVEDPNILSDRQAQFLVDILTLKHSDSQPHFARGRQIETNSILDKLPPEIAEAERIRVFTGYPDSIKLTQEVADKRREMVAKSKSPQEALMLLFEDLGYKKEGQLTKS